MTAADNPIKKAALPDYMVDMVAAAKNGAYLSKIGYEEAVRSVEVLMNKKTKPNAILLGHPGVGKSTIPEIIAYKIAAGQYSPRSVFFEAKLTRVEFTDLMAGTLYHGSLEARVKEMVQLAKKDPKIIYFIDEIHTIAGGRNSIDSRIDVSQMLLPVLARGEIRVIGASTFQDYNQFIRPKGGFARRFPQVIMDEPDKVKCFQMLKHSYRQISERGHIKISNEAILAAIFYSKDIPERYFPDKAVDLIDSAISSLEIDCEDDENELTLTKEHIERVFNSNRQMPNFDDLGWNDFFSQHDKVD